MSAAWLSLGIFLAATILLLLLLRLRKSGITGEKARNRHFERLAKQLKMRFVTDGYFIQIEGSRSERPVIIYPHNFEGPGFITLLYLESGHPARDNNWIEPNLSLGRAIVDWKRQITFNYEVNGNEFANEDILRVLEMLKRAYPYVAVTLPRRFSYSPLLQLALSSWKNYAVLLAMDVGREPTADQIEQAITNAEKIADRM